MAVSHRVHVTDERHVNTLDDADAHVRSLWLNHEQLAARIRDLEKMIDTKDSPWWKRLLFRLDGWSPWYHLDEHPRRRPWRRWWTS